MTTGRARGEERGALRAEVRISHFILRSLRFCVGKGLWGSRSRGAREAVASQPVGSDRRKKTTTNPMVK